MSKLSTITYHAASTDNTLAIWGGALLNLAIRWYVGWQFFKSGMLKVEDWQGTLALFHSDYHVPLLPPDIAAMVGAFGELTFPALLFIGLLSRPAALGLFCVNIVAVVSYPQLFKFECPAAINDHFYWGILIAIVFVWGPGKLSIDEFLRRHFAKRSNGI
jgi:putative oxidoreductase